MQSGVVHHKLTERRDSSFLDRLYETISESGVDLLVRRLIHELGTNHIPRGDLEKSLWGEDDVHVRATTHYTALAKTTYRASPIGGDTQHFGEDNLLSYHPYGELLAQTYIAKPEIIPEQKTVRGSLRPHPERFVT